MKPANSFAVQVREKQSDMKIAEGLSWKWLNFRSEMKNYRFRPSEIEVKVLRAIVNSSIFQFAVKLKFPTRGTREDFMYNGTFHEAVGVLLAFGQLFGIMPVSGVRAKSPKKLKFRKFSLRFVLCLVVCCIYIWMTTLDIIWIANTERAFGKLRNLFFNLTNLISILCFLELATKWPAIMVKWYEVEKFLPQLKYQLDKQKLAYEVKMISLIILSLSMGEFSFRRNRKIYFFFLTQLNISYQ